MENVNIEIKARAADPAAIRAYLIEHGAEAMGTDHQIDTYFSVARGRLKIREGTIENCIVWYERPDTAGPKRCDYIIEKYARGDTALTSLKAILTASVGVRAIVDKRREIYFIGRTKFHIDEVKGLGSFFEIEAIGGEGATVEDLRRECGRYLAELGIREGDLVEKSYGELVLEKEGNRPEWQGRKNGDIR